MDDTKAVEPDKIYPLSDAAKILDRSEKSLRATKRRGLIELVKSGDVIEITGREIERYKRRPTKNGLYSYENMLPYIPELTKEEFNDWVMRIQNEGRYRYEIQSFEGMELNLRLNAAQRLYADMTLKK